MDVKGSIEKRRAYRSLEKVDITKELVEDLAYHASLSPSCFNNQPWRYVFVYDPDVLKQMYSVLSDGNEWAKNASMIIAVFCKKDDDCVIYDREYYLFDTGLATGFLVLRATELGLVAHPIAGYSPKKTRSVLSIPDEMNIITLVIVGKHSEEIKPELSEKQKKVEKNGRPKRLSEEKFVYHNRYK
ncbi:MAG: nitroreductase family protein [Candidatus Thermoplasmatota archaeon]